MSEHGHGEEDLRIWRKYNDDDWHDDPAYAAAARAAATREFVSVGGVVLTGNEAIRAISAGQALYCEECSSPGQTVWHD